MQDRQSYQPGPRVSAVKRAKQYRGRLAMQRNQEQQRTEKKPGTGGFTQGIALQQARLRKEGQELQRAKQLRETTLYL